jgi:RNA polymerase sigma-70 factor, ECF subfamily
LGGANQESKTGIVIDGSNALAEADRLQSTGKCAHMSESRQREFENLARRFHAGIYNYLRWLGRDAELAEDLTQETFLKIWKHPPELRSEQALKAWVYKVARNEFLQNQRRRGLTLIAWEDCEEAEVFAGVNREAQIRLEREELARLIQGAVEKLPGALKEVIVLHNLEGLSVQQMAEVLGIPAGTIKSRRAKAISHLRQMLADGGGLR